MRVGFIGVGVMGAPIARNILKGGFPLTVIRRLTPAGPGGNGSGLEGTRGIVP
jgi:3-hydroxyisobutyrate dehydrogenase-like beta-hydroxyacid dehydrogenase